MLLRAATSATRCSTSTERFTPSAVVGTAYFWNADSRMPQTWVAPMSRATARASSRRAWPRLSFSRSLLEMSVSASRPSEKVAPMPAFSSCRRVKSASIEPGSRAGISIRSKPISAVLPMARAHSSWLQPFSQTSAWTPSLFIVSLLMNCAPTSRARRLRSGPAVFVAGEFWPQGAIQCAERGKAGSVEVAQARIGFDHAPDRRGGRHGADRFTRGAEPRQPRRTEGRPAVGTPVPDQGRVEHGGDDAPPEQGSSTSTDEAERIGAADGGSQHVQAVREREGDALEDRLHDVGRLRRSGQTDNRAARVGVVVGGALAKEVGQREQARWPLKARLDPLQGGADVDAAGPAQDGGKRAGAIEEGRHGVPPARHGMAEAVDEALGVWAVVRVGQEHLARRPER